MNGSKRDNVSPAQKGSKKRGQLTITGAEENAFRDSNWEKGNGKKGKTHVGQPGKKLFLKT